MNGTVGIQGHNPGLQARGSTNSRESFLDAQHADGIVSAVGGHGVGGDHRAGDPACQAQASGRIDNVRVANPGDLDKLVQVAGGGDPAVGKAKVDLPVGGFSGFKCP